MPLLALGSVAALAGIGAVVNTASRAQHAARSGAPPSPSEVAVSALLAFAPLALLAGAGALRSARGSRAVTPLDPEPLVHLLATLRALQIVAHEAHWVARGPTSYSDHLLLERVYAGRDEGEPSLEEEIDAIGEQIVGRLSPDHVSSVTLLRQATQIAHAWTRAAGPDRLAIVVHAERVAIPEAIRNALRAATSAGATGLENRIQTLADHHDTLRYLLDRRVSA